MAEEIKPQAQAGTQTQAGSQPKPPPVEKQTNCLSCNKQLKRLKRYYRDGKFYCSKKCWKEALKKKDTAQQ